MPKREMQLYAHALDRVEETARCAEVFLPIDLPLAIAAALNLDNDIALRTCAATTMLWAGADLMDDIADGDLDDNDWQASPQQLALIYTNLLATLPHLVHPDLASPMFSQRLAETLLLMSHGQFADLESVASVRSEADYLSVIGHKAGAEAAFFAGAPLMLAGRPKAETEEWESFGFLVGCMVQLFSDIHGTFVESSRNDLLHGKRTLPVLHALDNLAPQARQDFVAQLERLNGGKIDLLPKAAAHMYECGSVRYALREVERFRYRAAAALPIELRRLSLDHPLRRLLKSCSVLAPGLNPAMSLRADDAAAPPPTRGSDRENSSQSRYDGRCDASVHADSVAAYYDAHTDPFYLRLWDQHDIHFGLFGDETTDLQSALKAMTRAIVAPAAIQPGEYVVDAGCGVGGAAFDVAREHGARVLGLTISSRQVEIARVRAEAAGLTERVEFVVADCSSRLPVDDESVDVIMTIEAACHFADKARFLRECYRALRLGGRLVGSDWMRSVHSHGETADAALSRVEASWHLAELATGEEWRALLLRSGFVLRECEDFGLSVRPNAHLLAHARLDLLLESARDREPDPVVREWLEQCGGLSYVWEAGWFSIARWVAEKPH